MKLLINAKPNRIFFPRRSNGKKSHPFGRSSDVIDQLPSLLAVLEQAGCLTRTTRFIFFLSMVSLFLSLSRCGKVFISPRSFIHLLLVFYAANQFRLRLTSLVLIFIQPLSRVLVRILENVFSKNLQFKRFFYPIY